MYPFCEAGKLMGILWSELIGALRVGNGSLEFAC